MAHKYQQFVRALLNDQLTTQQQVELISQISLAKLSAPALADIVHLFTEKMIAVNNVAGKCVDLVGTGGDGKNTFNVSTTACFVACAAGVPMIKHGNQSTSSRSGGFDCLKALNVPFATTPALAKTQFNKHKIAFLSARDYHPAYKNFVEARKILAKQQQKTLFNIMGPLLNPAKVKRIAIGIYDPSLLETIIEALKILDYEKAIVFHGDGYDEVTLTGPTQYAYLQNGKITIGELTPERLDFSSCEPKDIQGGDPAENASITTAILANKAQSAQRDMVILNAAMAILVSAEQMGLLQACELARQVIASGKAYKLLTQMQGTST